jgi:hypothetical protein
MLHSFSEKLRELKEFDNSLASQVLKFQLEHNPWYARFAQALNFEWKNQPIDHWPFIPIDAFKRITGFRCMDQESIDHFFLSSGTGNAQRAKHHIRDLTLYEKLSLSVFEHLYPLQSHAVLAYLPGYAENTHSSLIHMLKTIIEADESGLSGFLNLENPQPSEDWIHNIMAAGKRIVLFGAAFGLVDLAEQQALLLPANSIIVETGGMKTYRKSMSREQIKESLSKGLVIPENQIHSEFGMCELLSQAYEQGDGWYQCPPWMTVLVKREEKPLSKRVFETEGQLHVIDLANVYSCSFVQTMDRAIQREDGAFKVLGRIESAPLRGCNFLMEDEI